VSHSYLLDFETDSDILLLQIIFGLFLLYFLHLPDHYFFESGYSTLQRLYPTNSITWITTLRFLIFLSKHIFQKKVANPFGFFTFLKTKINIKKYFQTNYIISSLVIFLLVTMANPMPMFFGVTIMAMGEYRELLKEMSSILADQ
jgi:hypothetical protein